MCKYEESSSDMDKGAGFAYSPFTPDSCAVAPPEPFNFVIGIQILKSNSSPLKTPLSPVSHSRRLRSERLALMVLRMSFALLVPALIVIWTVAGVLVGQQSTETLGNTGAAGALGGLYQAATPTIEVYDPNTEEAATPTPIPQDERKALLNQVWGTIEQNYLDPEFNGADWQALRDEYLGKALDAPTSYEFYGAISGMVGKLNDERAAFTPPRNLPAPANVPQASDSFANIGVTGVYEDNSLLVLYVYADGPAGKSGMQRRDRIASINGKPVTSAEDAEALSGMVGTPVDIVVRSFDGQARQLTLKREILVGQPRVSARQLAEDPTIAYLAMPPSMEAGGLDFQTIYHLDKQYRLFQVQDVPVKGLVIDLRHTGGSSQTNLIVAMGQISAGKLGSFEARNPANSAALEVLPCCMYDRFANVPLVLLVDEGTQADAEIMAAALQASGRARLVGTRTAGVSQSTAAYSYEDGSSLVFPQWRYLLPDGSNVDGRGLQPDVEVTQDWTLFAADNDPYIQAAVSLLHSMTTP